MMLFIHSFKAGCGKKEMKIHEERISGYKSTHLSQFFIRLGIQFVAEHKVCPQPEVVQF